MRPPSRYIDKINAKVVKPISSRDSLLDPNRVRRYVDRSRKDLTINPRTLVPALMNQYRVLPEAGPEPYVDFGYVNPDYVENTP